MSKIFSLFILLCY